MRLGFVVSETNWDIVRSGLDPTLEVSWAAHFPDQLNPLLQQDPVNLLIVEARWELLTPEVVDQADSRGIVIAALMTSRESVEVATERGVGERIHQPVDLVSLVSRLSRVAADQHPSGGGLLLVVWGATGAPGRTTMALTTAAALSAKGLPVMVVDADPRGGTVASALGLLDDIPGFLAACRLAGKDDFTTDQVRRLRSVYQGSRASFHVLTGVSRMLAPKEADRDSVDRVLSVLRSVYPVVIVDAGSDLSPVDPPPGAMSVDYSRLTSHLVSQAEELIAIIAATPVGVARFARAQADFDALRGSIPARYWLNGVDQARKALKGEALLQEALWRFTRVDHYTVIPEDFAHVREAEMTASTLLDSAGKQPILQALGGEFQRLEALASPRWSRQQRAAPEVEEESPPEDSMGVVERGLALWQKLTALR